MRSTDFRAFFIACTTPAGGLFMHNPTPFFNINLPAATAAKAPAILPSYLKCNHLHESD
ncbi:hypothetical protein [Niastella populi]|uniref:hypothetical protein n=1 Tax=Niastella populi TaxID=550983 RepID=UPI0013FD70B8|nr:hypothetical protein [Niastella populi]